jgi:hypothetical protein
MHFVHRSEVVGMLPACEGTFELNVLKPQAGSHIAMLGYPRSVEGPRLELQHDPRALTQARAAGAKPHLLPWRRKSGEGAWARMPLIQVAGAGWDPAGLLEDLIGHIKES